MALPVPSVDEYFEFLASWYVAHCDGEWEHEFGVRIETVDNPGWNLRVDIIGTEMEGRIATRGRREFEGGGWLIVESDGRSFEASCDAMSLRLAVQEFKKFVDTE
ncbi:Imm53 family immunity protein [Actinoplanes sp. CA-142083]|uniref:Imm53 family immunity protein n=1 Tax=Actinoplanes sp. CA-142083 TaxID=3239903 RepID=UPI003D8A404B